MLREELINMDQRAQAVGSSWSEHHDDQHRSFKPKDEWHQVPFISRKMKSTMKSSLQIIPPTHNKYEILSNLKEDSAPLSRVNQVKSRKIEVKNSSEAKHNVVIIGDSHARGSASRLQHNLGKDYVVSSFVKPGAQMKFITTTANEERKSLKSEDVLVIWGGSNNISKNNMREAISNVSELVKENKEANIVLIAYLIDMI